MIDVNLIDKGNKIIKTFPVPEEWNDLTPKQLLWFCRYVMPHLEHYKELPQEYQYMRVKMLLSFLNVSVFNIWRTHLSKLNEESITALTEKLDFLFQDCKLTKNLLPEIKVGWFKKLLGPLDNFSGMKFGEFVLADALYVGYLKTRDEKLLNQIVAILYRPEDKECARTDRRVRFNREEVGAREKLVQHIPVEYKNAVLLWYAGCREELLRKFPDVFNGESKGSGNMVPLLINLSGDKFGTVRETEETDLSIVLIHLRQLVKKK